MDAARFTSARFGRPIITPGGFGHLAYRPEPLPSAGGVCPGNDCAGTSVTRPGSTGWRRTYLVDQEVLTAPLVYLSSYSEANKDAYYDRLQAVCEHGDVDGLLFFLTGVAEQAGDAVARAEDLVDCRECYRRAVAKTRSRVAEVVDLLLENPVQTRAGVARRLRGTDQGAANPLRTLTAAGVLREVSSGRGSRARWYAQDVLDILT